MFDNSRIEQSQLSNQLPVFDYDTTELKEKGFECKYALDSSNPVYLQVINECNIQGVSYEIVSNKNSQEHIWIKTI